MASKKATKKSTRKPTKKVANPVMATPGAASGPPLISGYVEPVALGIFDEPKNEELVAAVLDTAPPTPQKTRWQQWCEWWDK